MVQDTQPSQDAFTNQIWDSLLQYYKRYAPDTIIIKTRSEVKVTVARKLYVRLHHPKMHIHSKFGIPTSKNIRDMLRTQKFLKQGQRSRSQRLKMVCVTLCHLKMHLDTKFGIPI